jgi:hypothetical protein
MAYRAPSFARPRKSALVIDTDAVLALLEVRGMRRRLRIREGGFAPVILAFAVAGRPPWTSEFALTSARHVRSITRLAAP